VFDGCFLDFCWNFKGNWKAEEAVVAARFGLVAYGFSLVADVFDS
jgi:hypothetical protein